MKQLMPQIVCKNGARISVQASSMHYCEPRNDSGPYEEVEAGFPTIPPSWICHPEMARRAEDRDNLTETVYAYTDWLDVQRYIFQNGGYAEGSPRLSALGVRL